MRRPAQSAGMSNTVRYDPTGLSLRWARGFFGSYAKGYLELL